jgi:hypothetical protein
VKAEITYVNAQLATRDTAIGTKSDQNYVDSELNALDGDIAGKASIAELASQLALRDTAIASRVSTTELASELSTRDTTIAAKASQSYVEDEVDALDAELATKATIAGLASELASRDTAIAGKTPSSTTSALDARVTTVESVVTATASYHYLETGEDALVIRGTNEIAANFLGASAGSQEGNALFYKDVTTFGTTTTPTLQTTLVKARDATGLVLTTSGGTTVLQSAENGDLVVPHALQCSGVVAAGSLQGNSFVHNGTLLSTQLSGKEDIFEAHSPLQKTFNAEGDIGLRINPEADLEVTDLHLRGDLTVGGSMPSPPSPFFCAGKVDGNDLSILSSMGRVGFTMSRHSISSNGVYKITFKSTNPFGSHYVINTTNQQSGHCKVWDNVESLPDSNSFHIVTYSTAGGLQNSVFHFSVIG